MRCLLVAACLLATTAGSTTAMAAPTIVAHRGGALADGVPVAPENTLPAFKRSAEQGWVLEFDVSLTSDRVPVVVHDDTLDRVSNCSGPVKARTAAQLRAECWIDVLGSADTTAPNPERTPIPTLTEVLELAAEHDAVISPEIKNIPPTTREELLGTDDFDPDPRGFATTVSQALAASGYPQERMIVQSFWPPNLDVAAQYLPDAELSFVTLEQMNDPGPEFSFARGYDWISPGFSGALNPTYVERARAYGRKITVYTPNSAADIAAAKAAGVDAIITDDPTLAARP